MEAQLSRHRRLQARRAVYRRRRFAVFGLVVGLVLALAGWQFFRFWNRPLSPGAAVKPTAAGVKKFTMLVVGADDRPDQPGRSDTILLGFADLEQGTVKLLSVPRDSYVEIPGHGYDKINSAYAYGKTDLTRQSVEKLIGTPVDYAVTVNMQGFEQIVDAVGGVDIEIDENMDYDDPFDNPPLHIHLKKGLQHLNGVDALHYVRFRHDAQSDWGRMKRQQNFLSALAKAAQKPANLARMPQILKLVTDNVTTNLSPSQITQMAMIARDKVKDQGVASLGSLPGEDLWTDYGYYLAIDIAKVRETVRELAGVQPDDAARSQDARDVAAYNSQLPRPSKTTASADAEGTKSQPATPPGSTTPGTTKPGGTTGSGTTQVPGTSITGTQTGGQPSKGSGGTGTGTSPAPGTGGETGTGTGTQSGGPPWPLVVVDGSGGTRSSLINQLATKGFKVVATEGAKGVDLTTIVWYNAPAQAAEQLRALLPQASFVRMTPGPGDPPLKLILGLK